MFNNGTDPTLISRQFQRIQERRMYLSQQQYSREADERTNVTNNGHSSSVLANLLRSDQNIKTVQRPSQNTGSLHPSTSIQDSMSSANQTIQETTVPSDGALRPATSTNQETVSNDRINCRQELLMEVLSQFEKRVNAHQNKGVECSKRQLNSNNGVAFDWGKLPRIGSVHSVQGIVGQERVNTSLAVGSKEPSSNNPLSRMGKIKMAELARLILDGTFDNFLNPSFPKDQTAGNVKTATVGLNSASEENDKDSNQVSRVESRLFGPRVGSSSQDRAVNSVPANAYENRQQETSANQIVSTFNQSSAYPNTSGSLDPQSNQRTSYITNTPNFPSTGRHNIQSNQRTLYNTNNGNPNAAGSYDTQSKRRTNYSVNTSNLSTSGNHDLQANQRASYNTGISNRNASGRYDRQTNQLTSYSTSFNHQNVSHMTHGQTPGVYMRTPVPSSYPRPLRSVPSAPSVNSSSCYIRHPLTSIPVALSIQPAGINAYRDYRFSYPHRATRTARVEPLSNHTNIVQPSPRATHVTTSNTTTPSSPGYDFSKNAEHDPNSCLDCSLLGTCPIKKAIAAVGLANEKEKEPKDSSDEEPELIITKVTTKDAERGPIERIDVDEWACSSESHSESVKVKQEPADKEEVAHAEKSQSVINNIVNQMRLMARKLLTEDGVLHMGTNSGRNEQNSIDNSLNSDSVSIQESVSDSNAVDRQQVAVSEDLSTQPTSDATDRGGQNVTESSTMVGQEASSEFSEGRNTIIDRTSEDIATDQLTAYKVTEKSIVQDRVTMEIQAATEAPDESIILEHVTEDITTDIQTTSEVTAESITQEEDPGTIIAIDTQTAFDVNQESIAQYGVTEGVTMDTQPATESVEENVNQGHITEDINVDRQSVFGVTDIDQDADATQRNVSNERSDEIVGDDNYPLATLTKRIKSLEHCINFLKQRANSDCGPSESEYDKGDRNYQKYVLMEGGELADQDNDETVRRNTKSVEHFATSRTISQRICTITEMSLQDKEAMESLERELEENEEKLKNQNVVPIRTKYLKERLYLLKKIERIRQKYEMSLQDREAIDNLEKRLEMNQEKLKNQNVAWIRKNCLKARKILFKKIDRIRGKYGFLPEEPSSLNDEDLEGRNIEDNPQNMESLEAEAAPEVNAALIVVENRFPLDAVPDQENVCEFTRNSADSLEMPKSNAGMNQENERLSNEATDQAEEVTSEEGSALESIATDLNNKLDMEEENPVLSEETNPMADPSTKDGLSEKSEVIRESNVEEAFILEDAIEAFVEKPRNRQDETSGEKSSTPFSLNNHLEVSSPLQNENQENRGLSFPYKGKQDKSDKSVPKKTTTNLSTESLPLMNRDSYIIESTRITNGEAQAIQLPEIQDLSNESTNSISDRAFPELTRADQFGESANISNAARDSPASKNILRKEKRKSDAKEEHVIIKKEKIDADQENTPQKENSYNIWDFIKKYSHR
ncbi:uncharacterized protein LOC116308566 isoform X2 [Actinia tenebrosa]|nr:uncharacterized protein LOC116308566 isoform X2 [Actinia tenebrosa]